MKGIFIKIIKMVGIIFLLGIAGILFLNVFYQKNEKFERAFTAGEIYSQKGEYEKAIESYKQALPSKRLEIDAETSILRIYKILKKPEKEIEFLKDRLKNAPDKILFDRLRLSRIGEIYWKHLKDHDNAKLYYQKDIDRFHDISSMMALSEIYEDEGDIEKAIHLKEMALKRMVVFNNRMSANNKAKRLEELGNLYLKVGRTDEAKKVFDEAKTLKQ